MPTTTPIEHTPDTAEPEPGFTEIAAECAALIDLHDLPPLYAPPWTYRGRWMLAPGSPMRDVSALLAWAQVLDEGGVIITAEYIGPGTWLRMTGRLGGRLVVLTGCTPRLIAADIFGHVAQGDVDAAAAAELAGDATPVPDPDPRAELERAAAMLAGAGEDLDRADAHAAAAHAHIGPAPAGELTEAIELVRAAP